MDQSLTGDVVAGEITIRDFFADLKRSKIMIFALVGALTLVGALAGAFGQKEYKATIVLLPVSESEGGSRLGGLSSLASQYSGLASLAGISLPESGMKDEAMAVLQSQLLTREYIRQNNLLPILYAPMWNPATKQWKTQDPRKVPTLWTANLYFKNKIRSVVDDKKTGMIEMTIEWKDPDLAAEWANGLVALTNSYLRSKAIDESQRNIAYLDGLVAKTSVVQEQQVIYALMEQQISKEMVAKDREEYALKVIDPAFPPERPSSGGPVLLGLLGFTLGLFFGIIVVFVKRALRE
jgi:uncharacterized protein involved in exopolysaccharide biosynthesis